jgi:hypothetical protein
METEKFEKLVKKRISSDLEILNKAIEKEKQTVRYLYTNILRSFSDEFENYIVSYNEVLDKEFKNLNIYLYYGDHYNKKKSEVNSERISIIFKRKDENDPKYGSKLMHQLNIKVDRKRGWEEIYTFKLNYFLCIGYNEYEEKEMQTTIDETNKDKLIQEISDFSYSFIDAFFDRGYDNSMFIKTQ